MTHIIVTRAYFFFLENDKFRAIYRSAALLTTRIKLDMPEVL